MAAITKSSTSLASSLSVPASTPTASTTLSASTYFSIGIAGTIVNGGTGPTIACTAQLRGSIDNSTWYVIDQAAGVTGAGVTIPFAFNLIPDGWLYLQVNFTGNTGQAVTGNAVASYGTAFS